MPETEEKKTIEEITPKPVPPAVKPTPAPEPVPSIKQQERKAWMPW